MGVQPTLAFIDGGRHELKGADGEVATMIANWMDGLS
jgi:hypothetical protein